MSTVDEHLGTDMEISPDEQESLRLFWDTYSLQRSYIQEELREAIDDHAELGPLTRATDATRSSEEDAISYELETRALLHGEWGPHLARLRSQGRRYAQVGLSIGAWFDVVRVFRRLMVPRLVHSYSEHTDKLLSSIRGMDKFISIAIVTIVQEYMHTKEEIILKQQETLRELSTPVLQLRDRMLLLPLVGMVDSSRARQLTEQLLNSIRSNRAKVVVIDITGVLTVDSAVANHLLQTVRAARLMGASSIVTGLSVEIAQTLTRIGVDLSNLNTVGDLQGGIEEAERLLGYRVVNL